MIVTLTTRIYLVNAGDNYYPNCDNTKAVFTDRDLAEAYAVELEKKTDDSGYGFGRKLYDWVEVYAKDIMTGVPLPHD